MSGAFLLRLLLAVALALFAGPRMGLASSGEMICGMAQPVAFDFETGKPKPPAPAACDHCALAKSFLGSAPVPAPRSAAMARAQQPAPPTHMAAAAPPPARARAPPFGFLI
ncbi:MAG: hypothetical protein WD969_08195 [Paracoccaceae bacterium]